MIVKPVNSLVGTDANERVGDTIYPLADLAYVVATPNWGTPTKSAVGAVTWCPGDGSCTGPVNAAKSLVGSSANDKIGDSILIEDNRVIVESHTWSDGVNNGSGAVTLLSGSYRLPVGTIDAANSVLGGFANDGQFMQTTYDQVNGQVIVSRPKENMISFFQQPSTSQIGGDWDDPYTWDYGVPTTGTPTILTNAGAVTVSKSDAKAGDLTIQSGATLAFTSGSLNLGGDFTNHGSFTPGSGRLILTGGLQAFRSTAATTFNNLAVMSGATLVEVPSADLFTLQGSLINLGTIRKNQPVSGSGDLSFGLTGVMAHIETQGGLTSLRVDRVDQNSPDARKEPGGYNTLTGKYWNVTAITNPGAYSLDLDLYLPSAPPDQNSLAKVCHYSNNAWACDRTGANAAMVWLNVIDQAGGSWALGIPSIFPVYAPLISR